MAWNGKGIYDTEFDLWVPIDQAWPGWPGSADKAVSLAWMTRATLLLGVLLFVADLCRRPQWFLRLLTGVALTGTSIALLGLLQKGTGAEMIFWGESRYGPPQFFATYFYHANAGAYLNLVLPVVFGLAYRALHHRASPLVRGGWIAAALVTAGAVVSNTSRAAQAIGLLLMLVLIVAALPRVRGLDAGRGEDHRRGHGAAAGRGHLRHWAGEPFGSSDRALAKHRGKCAQDLRWPAARTALRGVPEAGLLGYGPGTFRTIFPHVARGEGTELREGWRYLHQDYLQTLLEWGWLGGALWAALFFGGAAAASGRSGREDRRWEMAAEAAGYR